MAYPALPREQLKKAQEETLTTPRLKYSKAAKAFFWAFDLIYGKKRRLEKAKVLEVIARMPYQAWERRGCNVITRNYRRPDFARRVFDYVLEARAQQDNEQWHLFIIEELMAKKGIQQGFLRFRFLPQIIAVFHYWLSAALYLLFPSLSYKLNEYFEDHAEHEYMLMVEEHPEWEEEAWQSAFSQDYGVHRTVADLFRQIGHDERIHKIESGERARAARFR